MLKVLRFHNMHTFIVIFLSSCSALYFVFSFTHVTLGNTIQHVTTGHADLYVILQHIPVKVIQLRNGPFSPPCQCYHCAYLLLCLAYSSAFLDIS